MKKTLLNLAVFSLTGLLVTAAAHASTVTVVDNGSNMGTPGTFYWAITNTPAGGTIDFNIPGAGPHYLQIPTDGFPLIYQQNNLTIDGYTQPGASPNSNPITGANNAVIKIVIDGRTGGSRNMAYETYLPGNTVPPIDNSSMSTERSGYGSDERALLGVYRSTNVTIKGLAFLGTLTPLAGGDDKGICFAHDYGLDTNVNNAITGYPGGSDAYGHIAGCWFGVNPTNPTVAGVVQQGIAISGYRHRDKATGGTRPELPNVGMIIGVAPGAANPRSEFNIFCGFAYAFDIEGIRQRCSGNFFGVLPDGVTPYNTTEIQPGVWAGGDFEYGRYADTVAMVIGTDGDGVNDADEGNVFGPLAKIGANAQSVFDCFNTENKPWIIAGNRFGIAGNGTIWTNNSFTIGQFRLDQRSQVRFGSDFNGVSDALEANIIANNNTFADVYPSPATSVGPSSIRVLDNVAGVNGSQVNGWLSARGNQCINNWAIYNPNDPTAGNYTNNWAKYVDVNNDVVPVLSASTITTLNGTFNAPTNTGATNLVVDVYIPDPQGQVNGAAFDYAFFGGVAGAGFVSGKTYLGSFLDNGQYDSNPAVGAFSFNIAGLGIGHGTNVTVAVTYSQWARPAITSIVPSGGNVTVTWSGDNGGPYFGGFGGPSSGFGVAKASSISGPWTTTYAAGNSTTVPASGAAGFFRIVAPISGLTTECAIPVTLP